MQRKAASIQPIIEIIARPLVVQVVAIDFVIKETTFRRLSTQRYNQYKPNPFFFFAVALSIG